ncbi:unnamed protein product, partial [Owenia fusiformis]
RLLDQPSRTVMSRTTGFNFLKLFFIFILCFIQTIDCGKKGCQKCKPKTRSGRKPQRNYTSKVTYSGIMDLKGSAFQLAPKGGLTDHWKEVDPNVLSYADVVNKGREFVTYVKERFNIDISTLTDKQIYMGSAVHFGDLTFLGYLVDADLRLVTKTTPYQEVNYYRNTKYKGVGYIIASGADTNLTGGTWTGLMPKNSAIFLEVALIDDSEECNFNSEPHIITTRSLDVHPAKYFNGEYTMVNTWEAEAW